MVLIKWHEDGGGVLGTEQVDSLEAAHVWLARTLPGAYTEMRIRDREVAARIDPSASEVYEVEVGPACFRYYLVYEER